MNNCQNKKYGWNNAKVRRSPFKTLKAAKRAEKSYASKKSIGFTATSSLKAMGRLTRSNGCYRLGPKYQ